MNDDLFFCVITNQRPSMKIRLTGDPFERRKIVGLHK
nr:MAG TPA: Protein of unknown function (DUF3970) [Caudoviricetes sp.]DAS26241.1 MAG TPA: Protein of unknown function (DUF3970) [Caudoviricetes sp.]